MAEKMGLYKCEKCGNIVKVLAAGPGALECCGGPMVLMEPKTLAEEGKEKHVPVIEQADGKITVKLGSVPHPMVDEHWIMWIELHIAGKMYVKHLNPGDAPEAEFCVCGENGDAKALAYCNLHGYWQS